MTDIYDQHRKHFERTLAAAVLDSAGQHVANVSIRYPADGAGRLYAYAHWLGTEMVRGSASGYGYDKATAALSDAVTRLEKAPGPEIVPDNHPDLIAERRTVRKEQERREAFHRALSQDGGQHWDGALRAAGFTVLQVV